MKLMLLGAPGAGKGTVAKMLTAIDGSVQISTGDILRAEVKAGSDLGKEAEKFMTAGDLVPDSLIMDMMEKRLQQDDCNRGFLLDGFPRTIPQAEQLDRMLEKLGIELDMVVNIDVPREIIFDRLCTRRTCSNPECQEIYNVKSNPPNREGICDKCGQPVVQRDDETEEAIAHRLDTYNKKTRPLVDYYEAKGKFENISGTSSDEVVSVIRAQLGV